MSKPSLSISQQLERLSTRGLLDGDGLLARALMTHGYFRLSGYWRYFQSDPSNGGNAFVHGTDFRDVLAVYETDADLRNLLLEGLSEVEIALRSALSANLCTAGGTGTEYLDEQTYSDRRDARGRCLRDRLLADLRDDVSRSKERHVRHHRAKAGVDGVPLWVATEALSFGTLSRMYGLLADERVRTAVAKRFGYTDGLASSFPTNLRAVAVFRNVCAHHGRIWNRVVHQDKPRLFRGVLPPGGRVDEHATTPWGLVAVLTHLVRNVRGDDSFADAVRRLADDAGPYWRGLVTPDPR